MLHRTEEKEEHGRHEQDGYPAADLLFLLLIAVGYVIFDGDRGPDPGKEQKARPPEHQDSRQGAEEDKGEEFTTHR